jgi:hypothetical protein
MDTTRRVVTSAAAALLLLCGGPSADANSLNRRVNTTRGRGGGHRNLARGVNHGTPAHTLPRLPKGFRQPKIVQRTRCEIDLPNLNGALRQANLPTVKPVVERVYYDLPASTAGMRSDLRVSLGKLSEAQWKVAERVYADGWDTNLRHRAYKPGHSYSLKGFLSPAMQANLGIVFDAQVQQTERPLTAAEQRRHRVLGGMMVTRTVTDTNCWNTTREVNRRQPAQRAGGKPSQFTVCNFDPEVVLAQLQSPQYSRSRTQAFVTAPQLKGWVGRWGANHGDTLIVKDRVAREGGDRVEMVHAASFVDRNLVFERVGNGLAARLTTLDNVLKHYPHAKFEVRQMLPGQNLPHVRQSGFRTELPAEMCEGAVYKTTIGVRDVGMYADHHGHHHLGPMGAN